MLRLNTTRGDVEHQLVNRLIACPGCGQPLRPWGHDQPRQIRVGLTDRHLIRTIRRRRARCPHCHVTHIVQDSRLTYRRRDTTRVIQHALALKRHGWGYRRVADQIDRPDSTVRNWYRHQHTNRLKNTTDPGSIT